MLFWEPCCSLGSNPQRGLYADDDVGLNVLGCRADILGTMGYTQDILLADVCFEVQCLKSLSNWTNFPQHKLCWGGGGGGGSPTPPGANSPFLFTRRF